MQYKTQENNSYGTGETLSEKLAGRLLTFYIQKNGKPKKLKEIEDYFNGLSALNNAGKLSKEETSMVKAWNHVKKLNNTVRYKVLSEALEKLNVK